jgi:nitrile hydratase
MLSASLLLLKIAQRKALRAGACRPVGQGLESRLLRGLPPAGACGKLPRMGTQDDPHRDEHSHEHGGDHAHEHDHGELDATELRVRALQTVLVQKGYVDPAALDAIVETYQTRIGPRNGARVVAKAWVDPEFREWLARDASAAIASLGYTGRQGELMVALFDDDRVHHMVVCTLCSCYPWPVLGLPPAWYKSAPYRARAVRDPRGVLADFGVVLPPEREVRVWDSTAEVRYLVIPQRPSGTEGMDEEQLAALVTRDSMIGTGLPRPPALTAAAT